MSLHSCHMIAYTEIELSILYKLWSEVQHLHSWYHELASHQNKSLMGYWLEMKKLICSY